MARRRRTSMVLETARQRLAGLKSLKPAPDYGPNLTLPAYTTQIDNFNAQLDSYNQMLAIFDDLQNSLDAYEQALSDSNRRILAATAAHYGTDSNEYEQAGGTRKSERKRPTRKAPGGSPAR